MASSTLLTKMACLLILTMAVVTPRAHAITCGQVVGSLLPCLGYLKNGGAVPPPCCDGIRSLNTEANTTPDRQQACACIKQAGQAYGINYSFANVLPGKCNVKLGIDISASTDCSRSVPCACSMRTGCTEAPKSSDQQYDLAR